MMDPSNRIDPAEVLPTSREAGYAHQGDGKGVKGCHPDKVILDEIADFKAAQDDVLARLEQTEARQRERALSMKSAQQTRRTPPPPRRTAPRGGRR